MLTSLIGERFSITEYYKVKHVDFHEVPVFLLTVSELSLPPEIVVVIKV